MFRYIEPEVSGGLGNDTIIDSTVHPPIIHRLHYEFAGWLEDDIIESFPCFLVTESLRIAFEKEKLNGFTFEDVKTSKSEDFEELYPNKTLPKFYWIKIDGTAGINDLGISTDFRLVVSSKTFRVLKSFNINNAEFEEFTQD